MSALRFSIANLLTAVAIIAVGLAALNSSSGITASLLTVVTTSVLLVSALAAIYRTGEARASWLGFALFGWFYFLVAFSSAFPPVKVAIDGPLREFRKTFWTLRIPDGGDLRPTSNMDTGYDHATKETLAWPSWHNGFGETIHCLVALLVALAGGVVGRFFYRRERQLGATSGRIGGQ